MLKIGDKIEIISMKDEPQYSGKVGVVTHFTKDCNGWIQVWGTWGGLCIYENTDSFLVLEK